MTQVPPTTNYLNNNGNGGGGGGGGGGSSNVGDYSRGSGGLQNKSFTDVNNSEAIDLFVNPVNIIETNGTSTQFLNPPGAPQVHPIEILEDGTYYMSYSLSLKYTTAASGSDFTNGNHLEFYIARGFSNPLGFHEDFKYTDTVTTYQSDVNAFTTLSAGTVAQLTSGDDLFVFVFGRQLRDYRLNDTTFKIFRLA